MPIICTLHPPDGRTTFLSSPSPSLLPPSLPSLPFTLSPLSSSHPPQQSRGVDGKLPSKVGEGQSGGWYQMFCCYLRWTGRTVLPYQPSSTSLAEGNDTGDVWPVDSDGCLDRLGPLGLIWTLLSKTFGEIREQWMLFLAFLNIGCKDFRSCCFYVLFHVFFVVFFLLLTPWICNDLLSRPLYRPIMNKVVPHQNALRRQALYLTLFSCSTITVFYLSLREQPGGQVYRSRADPRIWICNSPASTLCNPPGHIETVRLFDKKNKTIGKPDSASSSWVRVVQEITVTGLISSNIDGAKPAEDSSSPSDGGWGVLQ